MHTYTKTGFQALEEYVTATCLFLVSLKSSHLKKQAMDFRNHSNMLIWYLNVEKDSKFKRTFI